MPQTHRRLSFCENEAAIIITLYNVWSNEQYEQRQQTYDDSETRMQTTIYRVNYAYDIHLSTHTCVDVGLLHIHTYIINVRDIYRQKTFGKTKCHAVERQKRTPYTWHWPPLCLSSKCSVDCCFRFGTTHTDVYVTCDLITIRQLAVILSLVSHLYGFTGNSKQ